MTILITRPQPEANRLAKILEDQGYKSIINPLLKVRFVKKKINLNAIQAFITTSLNGIRGLAKVLPEKSFVLYVIGKGSADEAYRLGFQNVRWVDSPVDAPFQNLIHKIIKDLSHNKGRLVYGCGDVIRRDMVKVLSNYGYEIEKKIVYRTKPVLKFSLNTLQAIKNHEINRVLFFSPRTAEIFVKLITHSSLLRVCESMTAVCLSPSIAQNLTGLSWQNLKVASNPALSALLAQIHND